jgi:mannitol 2-dehydrogenase
MASLNGAALGGLAATVGTPGYDRAAVSTGIVHFGVGAFHRAHEAMFVDDILARGFADWAICGVGVLEGDRAVRDALRAQDNLYTLVTSSPDGTSVARVIGSIREYLYAPDDPERGPGSPRRPGDAHRVADDHGGRLQRQRRHRRVRPARPAHAARSATR